MSPFLTNIKGIHDLEYTTNLLHLEEMQLLVARQISKYFFKGRPVNAKQAPSIERIQFIKYNVVFITKYAMFDDCYYLLISRRPYQILLVQCIATRRCISPRCGWLFFTIYSYKKHFCITNIKQIPHNDFSKWCPL